MILYYVLIVVSLLLMIRCTADPLIELPIKFGAILAFVIIVCTITILANQRVSDIEN